MGDTRIIQYTTRPECADENAALVEAVFAALTAASPAGLSYTSYRSGDSFVHIVSVDGEANPLTELPEFAAFQAGIADRCLSGPTPAHAVVVGSYTASR